MCDDERQQHKDYLALSMEDWQKLEDWELENALQQVTGQMAIAQQAVRLHAGSFYAYGQAKADFANWNSIGKKLQSLIRSKHS